MFHKGTALAFGIPILLSFAANAASIAPDDLAQLKAKYVRPESIPFRDDNSFNDAKYQLGKDLFFDARLSGSGITSCAACHNPSLDWTDGMGRGVGFQHQQLPRKTPTLLNLAWDELFFWDGRADSLEQQALIPVASPTEMNQPLDRAVHDIDIPAYRVLFANAFPGDKTPVTAKNIAKAIATFERKIVSDKAPFDKWIDGDETAISQQAKRGFVVFNNKANCAACHSGWSFSDGSFHDIGLPDDDLGRGKILPIAAMQHAFKTVGLRNIDRRYPYMHNGSLATLEDVVAHYDGGFVNRASLDPLIKPLSLTGTEKADLVAFLHTLTSEDAPVTAPLLPR